MQRAALRERGHRAAVSKLPGYRAARLTRGYSLEEVAQGKGMTADRLRQIATSPDIAKVPVLVRHSMHMPPAARTLEAEYDAESNFFHHRMLLNLGDRSSGDYVEEEQKKGNLLYTSAKFTVPEPDDPHPEQFQSQLIEVSFVDEPHEPHAEILVAHSTTDSQRPVRVLNLCSRIINNAAAAVANKNNMSSAPVTPALAADQQQADKASASSSSQPQKQPAKYGGLTGDEVLRMIEEKKRLEAEKAEWIERQKVLEYFQQRHEEGLKPMLQLVQEAIESDSDLNEQDRPVVRAFIEEAGSDYRTVPALNWAHRMVERNRKLSDELTKFKEEKDSEHSNSEHLEAAFRSAMSSSSSSSAAAAAPSSFSAGMTPAQARQFAGATQPGVNQPLMAAHAAGGAPHRESGKPTRLSSNMYERIRQYRGEVEGTAPAGKRPAH